MSNLIPVATLLPTVLQGIVNEYIDTYDISSKRKCLNKEYNREVVYDTHGTNSFLFYIPAGFYYNYRKLDGTGYCVTQIYGIRNNRTTGRGVISHNYIHQRL